MKLRVGRRTVDVSNIDKVFFPDAGIAKGELIDYYQRIAEAMLPHVKDRPLAMERYPDGIEGKKFFQKDIPDYFPDWISRTTVKKEGGAITHVVAAESATLAYLANQGCITLHAWLSRSDKIDRPDQMIMDLDPPGDDFEPVRTAAKMLKTLFGELETTVYLKTTGSRGLHVVLPLDRSGDFDAARSTSRRIAELLVSRSPQKLTIQTRKASRRGRLFVDYLRNAYAQTAVAPYSVRAKPGAPVATPIDWSELGDKKLRSNAFTIQNIFRRVGRKEDPWSDMARRRVSLKALNKRLDQLAGEEGEK